LNRKLIVLIIAYTILNALIIVFPQMGKNKNLEQEFMDIDKIEAVSSEDIYEISDVELIRKIDLILNDSELNKISYTYSKDERETTQAHKVNLTVSGSELNINSFVNSLTLIEGLQLDELMISRDKEELNANINIIVIGGKNEKKAK